MFSNIGGWYLLSGVEVYQYFQTIDRPRQLQNSAHEKGKEED